MVDICSHRSTLRMKIEKSSSESSSEEDCWPVKDRILNDTIHIWVCLVSGLEQSHG